MQTRLKQTRHSHASYSQDRAAQGLNKASYEVKKTQQSGSKRVQLTPRSAVSSCIRVCRGVFLMSHPQSLSQAHQRLRKCVSISSKELRWRERERGRKKKSWWYSSSGLPADRRGCGASNGCDISRRLPLTPLRRRPSGCVTHAPYHERFGTRLRERGGGHPPAQSALPGRPCAHRRESLPPTPAAGSTQAPGRQHRPSLQRLQADMTHGSDPTSGPRCPSDPFTSHLRVVRTSPGFQSCDSLLSHCGESVEFK